MNASNTVVSFAAAVTLFSAAAVMADRDRDMDFEPKGHGPFSFALIGDTPYGIAPGAPAPAFDALVDDINHAPGLRWVMHAGDIKSGGTLCNDALYSDRAERFAAFDMPLVLTPGDNEWTDCHRAAAGSYAPLERLAYLRQVLFAEPDRTLGGRPMEVQSQADDPAYAEFPENVRWSRQHVMFATLHVVGSQNGLADFPGRTASDDAEVGRRTAATLAWLDDTFRQAMDEDAAGVFLMMQANPGLERGDADHTGFERVLTAIEEHTRAFDRPVILAHGDSHYFRVDKPAVGSSAFLPSLTRVETFGSQRVHWVKVTVDPQSAEVFNIQPMIVDANR